MVQVISRLPHLCVSLAALLLFSACAASTLDESNIPPLTEREQNLLLLARAAEGGQDTKPAIALYEQAVSRSKGSVEAHLGLANLYDRHGQRDKALEVMQKAKRKQRTHPLVNQQLGKHYLTKGEAEKALEHFEDGLKRDPHHVDLLNGKGVSLDMLARHAEAQESYQQALSFAEGKTDFIENNLAMSYIMAGDYQAAVELLRPIGKKDETMRQNLALAYGLMGNRKQAMRWGKKDLSKAEMQENLRFYKNYQQSMALRSVTPMHKPELP